MKLQEAYNLLELSPNATPEEAKKKYRDLTKRYHPDVNKEEDTTEKFKKINEAYECIKNGKGNDPEPPSFNPFDIFNQQSQQVIQVEHIHLHTELSFKEAVLGCKRDLKFNRKIKCKSCNGNGEIALNNGCEKCGGRGTIITKQANMIFSQTCNKCFGRAPTKPCDICFEEGFIETEASVSVSVPGGINNDNILRLGGMGNYAGNFFAGDQYTDAYLHLKVEPDPDFILKDKDVVSSLQISLLEALQGCHKTVKTILGEKEIEVKPLSKHQEEIILPHLGVEEKGNQRIILNVEYPPNIDNLINLLQFKEN